MQKENFATGGRAAVTALAIENAALDLALDRGYDNITVDMICERVGVSQRTFFNHFPTKDDALLGRSMPELDERAARRFILNTGPLLTDALDLVQLSSDGAPPRRMAERMRVIAGSAQLLVRQMERLATIEDEITEVIALRLQHQAPEEAEERRLLKASLITHLLMGALRWVATQVDAGVTNSEKVDAVVAQALALLFQTLPLAGDTPT